MKGVDRVIDLQAVFKNVACAVKYHAKAITVMKANKTDETYQKEILTIRNYLNLLCTRIR